MNFLLLYLNLCSYTVPFALNIIREFCLFHLLEKSRQNEHLLFLDWWYDLLLCQYCLASMDHLHQPLYLFLMSYFYLFVRFHLKVQAFCVVDPINPLRPGWWIPCLFKNLFVFQLCRSNLLIWTINDQVIIFSENWNQTILLYLVRPRQLLNKFK